MPSLTTWLSDARWFLSQAFGPQPEAVRVSICNRATFARLVYDLPSEPIEHDDGDSGPANDLGEGLARIYGACPAKPVTVDKLARLAGRQCDSYFRDQVRQLWDKGLIVRKPQGYCRGVAAVRGDSD